MSVELALLQRLVRSPYTPAVFWEDRPVIAIAANDHVLRDRGLFPSANEPVDATIRCSQEDLAALAAGRPPSGLVSYTLGDRPGAPRRKQARVLLALAALGWCGPWPDPTADVAHIPLLREAWFTLAIGPADGQAPLFPTGGPLPHVRVRLTEGAGGTELVTEGLADTAGQPELATLVAPRKDPRSGFPALRAAALFVADSGGPPPRRLALGDHALTSAPHPRLPAGLALPHHRTWLLRVTPA